jgi:3-oxoacyl-[acyl-carrier-protein] synthase II
MKNRRVVITGLGAVTPLGNTVVETWQALLAGKSGVGIIQRFDASGFSTRIAAEVKNFDPLLSMDPKDLKKTDTFIHYALEASRQAMQDANLTSLEEPLASRAGVAIGSGIGGLPWIEKAHTSYMEGGPRKISPFFIPGTIANMASGLASMKYGLKGPNISIVTACTTGAHNIGFAARLIKYGDADVMLAGGAEMATSPLGVGGFCAARALSKRNDEPEKASRPWDKDRDGFVLGEGAAVLVLEEYEHAQKRGAHIYAELIGFGMSADAYHMTSPEPDGHGFILSMQNALNDANIPKNKVNYINAHGTSTSALDHVESSSIKQVFGEHAYHLAVSSTKSMTGHMLGAAGAVEAVFSILAIRDNIAPPTINLDNPSEGCDLNFVPHRACSMPIDVVLSNSFGFGGTNGSLVFSRV